MNVTELGTYRWMTVNITGDGRIIVTFTGGLHYFAADIVDAFRMIDQYHKTRLN